MTAPVKPIVTMTPTAMPQAVATTASTRAPSPAAAQQTDPAVTLTGFLLGSTVIAALMTAIITSIRSAAAARRERYSDATAHLAAWTEFPFRVRRRTSDAAATLTALADVGHQLQEASARHRGWVAGESRAISGLYDAWLTELQRRTSEPLRQAWESTKVSKPASMNLDGFGPGSAHDALCAIETALAYRFGWRRMLPNRLVARRLRKRALFPPTH
jgi:hypothetical protein